jgi:serine/threonine-protein kinase
VDADVARLVREERVVEAATLAARRGDARTACDLFERACAWSRAAEQAAVAGDAPRAFLLAVLGGDGDRANGLLAQVAASKSATESTHATLERRGEAVWDARLLEAAGRAVDAAKAWERAGDATRAATLLEREGDVVGAARVLESAVRRDGAASSLLALGDLLLRYGKNDLAARSLQKIPPSSPERRPALSLLARAFDALGLARARLEAETELAALGGPVAPSEPSSADSPRSLEPGKSRLFGRYAVLREVASSASARVLECTDAVRGERVAVKIFAGYDARGAGRDALARFEREVLILGKLEHPNVVPLREYVAEGPAIVLAWMSGGTLDERLAQGGVTPARAIEIACAVLAALGDAHRLGVFHRDVKPANVLFDDAGVTRLGDFGVAHLGDLSTTATAGVIGTLGYMSPEQRAGRPATAESDIYSVGAMLLEMLTGERPGAGIEDPLVRPSGAHRDLHAGHDEVVLRMVTRDPAGRPADPFAARRALLGLAWPSTMEPAAPRTASRAPSERPQAGRADLSPDGTGFDRWMARAFEHVPLDDLSRARAAAFARAGHPALQPILRVDREAGRIWLGLLRGRSADALTPSQLASLQGALDALHAAGVAHGRVEPDQIVIDEDGSAWLRFTAAADATATVDLDRLALARLATS